MKLKNMLKNPLDEVVKKQHRYFGESSIHIQIGLKDQKSSALIFTKNAKKISDEKLITFENESKMNQWYNDNRKQIFESWTNHISKPKEDLKNETSGK